MRRVLGRGGSEACLAPFLRLEFEVVPNLSLQIVVAAAHSFIPPPAT